MIESVQWESEVKVGVDGEGEALVSKGPLQVANILGRGEFIMKMMGKWGDIYGIYGMRRKGKVAIVGFEDNLIGNRDRDEGTVLVD